MASLRIFKFIGAYTVLGFVPLAVSVFLLPLYTTYLSPAEYGIVTATNVTLTFVTLAITLGLDAAFGRFYFDYLDDPRGRYRLLGTSLYSIGALTLGLCLVFTVAGQPLFNLLWKGLSFRTYGWLVVLGALGQVVYGVLFLWFRNAEDLRGAVGISLLTTAASTMGSALAIVTLRGGPFGAVAGKAIGFAAGVLPFAVALLRRSPLTIDRALLRKLFEYGLPLVPYTVIAYVMFNGDRILVQRWFDLTTLGLYALAATLISPMEIVLQSGQQAVQPMFYRLLERRHPGAELRIGRFYVALVLANIVALAAVVIVAPPVLAMFRGAKYVGSAQFVPILALSQVFRTQYNAAAFSLFQSKYTRPLPITTAMSLVVGAATATIAPRFMGPIGIGLGVVAWKSFQQISTAIAMRRLGPLTSQIETPGAGRWIAAACAYVAGYYYVDHFAHGLLRAYGLGVGGWLAIAAFVGAIHYARRGGLFSVDPTLAAQAAPAATSEE